MAKFKTTRRSDDCVIGDEYPLASSHEGGAGIGAGRAILQGATEKDQEGK